MIRNILIFLSCTWLSAACSSEGTERGDTPVVNSRTTSSAPICFNHTLLILDSFTYQAAVNSEFINKFAYSQERQLKGYKGFYMFGKTNYIELFHPKSFDGHEEEAGGMWINLAPLKANYLKSLEWEGRDHFNYGSDEHFHDLSLILKDSVNPISTWEMTKEHYESWTHKKNNHSLDFLPLDYYSQQDSDPSSNYAMNEDIGRGLISSRVADLAMPDDLATASLALGASRWQTATRVVLPTASPGIFSAVMIGFGRAAGETMIVVMATGNTATMKWNVFEGFRTLSATTAVELPEAPAGSAHFRVLFLCGLVLFAMMFVLNTTAEAVRQHFRKRSAAL